MSQKLEECRAVLEKAGFSFSHRIELFDSTHQPYLALNDVKDRYGQQAASLPSSYIHSSLEHYIAICGLSWEWRGDESINVFDASFDWSGFDEVA